MAFSNYYGPSTTSDQSSLKLVLRSSQRNANMYGILGFLQCSFKLDMLYHIWYNMGMNDSLKMLPARFFKTASGSEPVREWLKGLDKEDSRIIGGDIRTVEYGWPIGMPVCRSIKGYKDLWEVRSRISNGRIARVIFHMSGGEMILLHGFIKKTQQTPHQDLELADRREIGV